MSEGRIRVHALQSGYVMVDKAVLLGAETSSKRSRMSGGP